MKQTMWQHPYIEIKEEFKFKEKTILFIVTKKNFFSRLAQLIIWPFTWIFFGYIKIK